MVAVMRIPVKCYATLRGYQPRDGALDVEEGTSVEGILHGLGIPLEDAKVIFVNGRHATLDRGLEDGDRIAVFPAVGGG